MIQYKETSIVIAILLRVMQAQGSVSASKRIK